MIIQRPDPGFAHFTGPHDITHL